MTPATAAFDAELVRVMRDLPAAPRVLVELGQLIRNPHTDSRDVVALLRQDSGLVARILQVANSAAYGRNEPVGSIEEAVASIGFGEVLRLVGAVAALQLADCDLRYHGMDCPRVRENALFTAVTMEKLAKVGGEDWRSCYTVGLLRSIGKIALERMTPGPKAVPYAGSDERDLDFWEIRTWGVSNCEVAERILLAWRLPHETVIAIKHHYRPAGKHNPVIHMLVLASCAAQDRGYGLPGEESLLRIGPENLAKAGLNEHEFRDACEHAQRVFQRLGSCVGG